MSMRRTDWTAFIPTDKAATVAPTWDRLADSHIYSELKESGAVPRYSIDIEAALYAAWKWCRVMHKFDLSIETDGSNGWIATISSEDAKHFREKSSTSLPLAVSKVLLSSMLSRKSMDEVDSCLRGNWRYLE